MFAGSEKRQLTRHACAAVLQTTWLRGEGQQSGRCVSYICVVRFLAFFLCREIEDAVNFKLLSLLSVDSEQLRLGDVSSYYAQYQIKAYLTNFA
jgi:hypothetical protein